jgi:large subunit ribosomal protein L32e
MNKKKVSKVRKESSPMLKMRKRIKKKKPGFSRQEGYRLKKLKKSWRRPRGRHSKLRKHERPRGRLPKVGYGSPKSVRGLTRYGHIEVRISNPNELEKLDPKKEAALISSSVGKKKRIEIIKKAEEKKIKIVNQGI